MFLIKIIIIFMVMVLGVRYGGGYEYVINQYADDTTFFIGAGERSVLNLYHQIESFGNFTGL